MNHLLEALLVRAATSKSAHGPLIILIQQLLFALLWLVLSELMLFGSVFSFTYFEFLCI